jgi:hypothetical protein
VAADAVGQTFDGLVEEARRGLVYAGDGIALILVLAGAGVQELGCVVEIAGTGGREAVNVNVEFVCLSCRLARIGR